MTTADESGVSAKPPDTFDQASFVRHYERSMYHPLVREYVGHSGFHNFGYWDETTRCHRQACENLMEKLLGFLPQKQGTILDAACGMGATTRYLLTYYSPADVVGVDLSEKQLETARSNAPGCRFRRMDAVDLDFENHTFDAVICVEAAFHFDTRERFLHEVRRVLKPGGHLVLTDVLVTREAERRRIGRTERNYVENPAAYADVLRRAGLSQVNVVDATEACWRAFFRDTIAYGHRKFLAREIGITELEALLEPTYGRVPDLQYYVLAKARRE